MRMRFTRWHAAAFAGALLMGVCAPAAFGADTLTNATLKEQVPVFQLDTSWPKLPNNWVLGLVCKINVDSHGNVWIIHRPRTVEDGRTPAPAVVVLDKNGKFVRAWGGPAAGYDWPDLSLIHI